MEPLLSVRNLEKYYGAVKALDGASIEVLPGEIHALLGANGAGKSTLMKVLCGELDYQAGEIILDGKRIEPKEYARSIEFGVGIVHQELTVVGELTVAQYIFLGREPVRGFKIDDKKIIADAEVILNRIGGDISPVERMDAISPAKQQLVILPGRCLMT